MFARSCHSKQSNPFSPRVFFHPCPAYPPITQASRFVFRDLYLWLSEISRHNHMSTRRRACPSPCGRRCAASARPGLVGAREHRIHPASPQNPGMVETLWNLPIRSIYLFRLLAGCRSREGLSVTLSDAYEYGSKLAYVITPSTN
jgi:hypothetical protein